MDRLVGFLIVVAASLAVAQTPQKLRNRYGEPDVERFRARPGIGLTVEYGSDHVACQILIQPSQQILSSQEEEARFMSSETVTDILEEVVPVGTRGKEIGHVYSAKGCNEFDITECENVSLARSTHNCLPLKREREMRATVTFKRAVCISQSK
ncbi:MAG: hypothetical protein DMG32_24910 [Acidobacteria bacterium]|nr:MAG: hypothetical protein DMG32_24910 [Acidobacteriota bacterium]